MAISSVKVIVINEWLRLNNFTFLMSAWVGEYLGIVRHFFDPPYPIVMSPFCGIIFPLEGIHPDDDEISRVVVDGRQALCAESASHGGGGCEGEVVPMGGMVDGVKRERLREGRRLRTMGGGGGGRRSRRWQQLRSIFFRWPENVKGSRPLSNLIWPYLALI